MILRQLVFGFSLALCVMSSALSARAQSSSSPPAPQPVPAPEPINPLTGPSFPCPQPEDPLAQLVCSTPTLALLDMQFVQTYEALYQQVGALGDSTLREQDIQFDMTVRSKCGIALSQASNPSATPPPPAPPGSDQCVVPAYQQQIALWKSMLLGAAAEEANRSIQDQVALQRRLQALGFLPPQAQIDGVFGAGTRAAIMKWQASVGRQQTGLIGDADAQALLPDNPPDSTETATPAPNAGQQPANSASPTTNNQPAADQNPLPMNSGSWTALEADGNFADTGSSGQQKIAMVLPQNSMHFEILLTGFQSNIPDGTTVIFDVTFDNGQSMSFSGQSSSNEVEADLDDIDVATWTHNLTADKMMAITFGGISEDPWTIPLSGAAPTVTAMAEGIKLAGITGLPAPWTIPAPDSSSDQTAPPVSPQGSSASQAQSQYPSTPNNPIPRNPQFGDCMAFAAYALTVPDLSDAQNLFGNYFQVNLASAPDSVFSDLSSFSFWCKNEVVNQNASMNGQYADYNRLISLFGPGVPQSSLQTIQSSNDQAAFAQQNADDIQKNAALIAGLPACDDPNTISEIKDTIANSPEGKVYGISLLGLTSITDVTGKKPQAIDQTTAYNNFLASLLGGPGIPMGYRVCQADALFNNGEREIDYTLKWFDKSSGIVAYSVSGAGD
jgi:peptidoglycan hydrolase-like protein with peptidoglycan-binding domain